MAENNQAPKSTPDPKPKAKTSFNTDIKKPSQPRRPKPPVAESQLSGKPKPVIAPIPNPSGKISASIPLPSEMAKGIKIIPAVPEDATPPIAAAPAVELKQKPAKPQVEGINAPYVSPPLAQTSRLTQAEVKIIKDVETPGKIFSPQITKSGSVQNVKLQGAKKSLWPYIILALLMGGFLLWRFAGIGDILKNYVSPGKKNAGNASQTVNQNNINPIASLAPETANPATATPAELNNQSVAAPAKAVTKLQVTSTPTGWLNVRTQPSLAGSIITKVHPGETYAYTETQNGWYYITLADGSPGWVSGRYITKIP